MPGLYEDDKKGDIAAPVSDAVVHCLPDAGWDTLYSLGQDAQVIAGHIWVTLALVLGLTDTIGNGLCDSVDDVAQLNVPGPRIQFSLGVNATV